MSGIIMFNSKKMGLIPRSSAAIGIFTECV